MTLKKLYNFLNSCIPYRSTEEDAIIYTLGSDTFLILGEDCLCFMDGNKELPLNLEDLSEVSVTGNRLNICFWYNNQEKMLSINLKNAEDNYISEKLSEAVFRIDVDSSSIKRLYIRAMNKGDALAVVMSQYPDLKITGITKFTEALNESSRKTPFVEKKKVDEVFRLYSDPHTDKVTRASIDWTMVELFGENWMK